MISGCILVACVCHFLVPCDFALWQILVLCEWFLCSVNRFWFFVAGFFCGLWTDFGSLWLEFWWLGALFFLSALWLDFGALSMLFSSGLCLDFGSFWLIFWRLVAWLCQRFWCFVRGVW